MSIIRLSDCKSEFFSIDVDHKLLKFYHVWSKHSSSSIFLNNKGDNSKKLFIIHLIVSSPVTEFNALIVHLIQQFPEQKFWKNNTDKSS